MDSVCELNLGISVGGLPVYDLSQQLLETTRINEL